MKNKYGLPEKELDSIRARDSVCVYCHKTMKKAGSEEFRGDWSTIEHLNHLPPWNNISTIAICCFSCNASRGAKRITDWFKGSYCLDKGINLNTVTTPVKDYVKKHESN
ncbi:MAG: hypothetical protein HQ488_02870 [Parcubacteria group bacterium]|nr:hypothetical protein [Parcubacteria group bacterium]